jgi:hypothetical protein
MNPLMYFTVATALAAGAAQAPSTKAPEGGDLAVTVTYTGKGEVKKGNEIGVFVWSTPDIGQSAPIATQVLVKNGGTAVFKDLPGPVVYVAVSYDEKGQYEETTGPPPTGTPVAAYTIEKPTAQGPPKPSPVKVGKGAKIRIKFDDSRRMQP